MNNTELENIAQRERDKQKNFRCRFFCCASTPCLSSGGASVKEALSAAVAEQQLEDQVQVVATGCMGPCSHGPVVTVQETGQPNVTYEAVTPQIAKSIVAYHANHGSPPPNDHVMPNNLPFFTRQKKVVLANSGMIDPEKLEDALATGGYSALSKALHTMTPDEVCNEIVKSGLRGRGGAGYPSGLKWNLVRKATADKKYIVEIGRASV